MPGKKNLMILISTLTGGGAELVVYNISRSIDKEKFNLLICCTKEIGYRGEDLRKKGFNVDVVPRYKRPFKIFKILFWLRKFVHRNRVNIINSHNSDVYFESALVKVMCPWIKTIHTYHYGNYPYTEKKIYLVEKHLWRIHSRLIAVGNEQKKKIQSTYNIKENRIDTIWNGVRSDTHQEEINQLNEIRDKVIIGSVSTLIKQKGLEDLIEVIKRINERIDNIIFVIAGDGPLKNELKELCKVKGVEKNVLFLGWIKNAGTSLLPKIDIFIQTSRWEAMSMVILEAMAASRAIIATRVGENVQVIDHGKNGLLVDPGDVDQMVNEIANLVKDKKYRDRLGKNARNEWRYKYSDIIMTKKYESIFKAVMH